MNWWRRTAPPRVGVCVACRKPGAPLDVNLHIHRRCTEQIMATVARESRPGWKAAC